MDSKQNEINVVLFGCGRAGQKHLQAIKLQSSLGRLRLLAVVDPKLGRTEISGVPVYKEMEELLAAQGTRLFGQDFASLPSARPIFAYATPAGNHPTELVQAISYGAHVFMEKPVALTVEDAIKLQKLSAEAKQQGLKIVVGHVYRYLPPFPALAEDLHRGLYGAPILAEVKIHWGHDASYYAPAWRGKILSDGGAVLNQGIHGLDLANWLLGGGMATLEAGLNANLKHDIEAEDYAAGTYRVRSQAIMNFSSTTITDPRQHSAEIFLLYEGLQMKLRFAKGKLPYLTIRDSSASSRLLPYLKRSYEKYLTGIGAKWPAYLKNWHNFPYADLWAAIVEDRDCLASLDIGIEAVLNCLQLAKPSSQNS
ncbi:MAG: Gfo/Idh/MocA family oxidoreductase [Eubacteriales bacterium]|nr:Gfo/Idh/MocA family oxidoreductase [Eubacteriales bacterium]